MKLKDYIKEVRNHILAYDYACVVALADHIVEDYKEYWGSGSINWTRE